MINLPAKYLAARKALQNASIEQANDIRNKAIAMEVYAMKAKDGELIKLAVEIRRRAVRVIGQHMRALKEQGKIRRGGDRKSNDNQKRLITTLKSLGIDNNLAAAARFTALLSETEFERSVEKAKLLAVASAERTADVLRQARAERMAQKQAKRAEREKKLAKIILKLPTKRYGVILADPEWQFHTWSEAGMDRAADNHYQTSPIATIKARDVRSIAAPNCVLFLWATAPMLTLALDVLMSWGFSYRTSFVWVKDRGGTGYWNRGRHELLLVGMCGEVPAPAQGEQLSSVIEYPVGAHSEKPPVVYAMIEEMFPNLPRIELNARQKRRGWDSWGLEVAEEAELEPVS